MTPPMNDASLTFRSAVPADAPAILELSRAAYAKWVPLIGREPLPMKADYDKAVREHLFILAEQGTVLVGLIELIPEDSAMLIENLAVAPAWQGQGLGAKLLTQAEDLARARGYNLMRLYTNVKFVENITFYAKRGFVETERRELVPGSIAIFMAKSL